MKLLHPMPTLLDERAGLIAGFTATVAMSILMIAQKAAGLMPQLDPIADIAHLAQLPAGTAMALSFGWIGHFALGTIIWGTIYAAMHADLPGLPVVRGLIFGALAWLAMMIVFMPMAGHGLFALSLGLRAVVATLVLHLVYGAVLGVAYARAAHE